MRATTARETMRIGRTTTVRSRHEMRAKLYREREALVGFGSCMWVGSSVPYACAFVTRAQPCNEASRGSARHRLGTPCPRKPACPEHSRRDSEVPLLGCATRWCAHSDSELRENEGRARG